MTLQRTTDGREFRIEVWPTRTRCEELRWLGGFIWGVLSVSPSPYQPASELTVTDVTTGDVVIRHVWTDTDAARMDKEMIERALGSMTMAEFFESYGIGGDDRSAKRQREDRTIRRTMKRVAFALATSVTAMLIPSRYRDRIDSTLRRWLSQ